MSEYQELHEEAPNTVDLSLTDSRKGLKTMKIRSVTLVLLIAALGVSLLATPAHAGARARAVEYVRDQGYRPMKWQFHRSQTLRVITGREGRRDNYYKAKVFFFVRHHGFVRADVGAPSLTRVEIVRQSDEEISLRYGRLYRRGDAHCCPSGDFKTVRFRWNGDRVWSVDNVPSRQQRRGYWY